MVILSGTTSSGESWELLQDLNGREYFFSIKMTSPSGVTVQGGFGTFSLLLHAPEYYWRTDGERPNLFFAVANDRCTSAVLQFRDGSKQELVLHPVESIPAIKVGVLIFGRDIVPTKLIYWDDQQEKHIPISSY